MEQAIREGGSVLYGGRIITRAEHLPSAAELAQGDPAAEAAAQADLQAQIADLQAQVAKLQAPAEELKGKGKAKDAPPAEA
jgi:predicted HD phosphohydrolase